MGPGIYCKAYLYKRRWCPVIVVRLWQAMLSYLQQTLLVLCACVHACISEWRLHPYVFIKVLLL